MNKKAKGCVEEWKSKRRRIKGGERGEERRRERERRRETYQQKSFYKNSEV